MLGLVIYEELGVVNCFGQGPVLMSKLCEVQPGGGEDQARIPDGMIAVRVSRIKRGADRGTRLGPGEETDGHRGGVLCSTWQETIHKGSHGRNRRVLTRGIVDVVSPESKVCR